MISISRKCNLWVHDDRFSKLEVIINPELFPDITIGDLVEILPVSSSQVDRVETDHHHSRSFSAPSVTTLSSQIPFKDRLIIQITDIDRELVAKQASLQISLAHHVANLFDFQPRKDVLLTKVDPVSVTADYIELTFKDQYIGRGDMFRLKDYLLNACVYVGKKMTFAGCIRAQIKEIYVNGSMAACGYISQTTKMIFRSESAKYFIFLQLSKEMFEFDQDGEVYFEKCVLGFLPDLFSRWKQIGANHVVSIVLFSRVYYDEEEYEKFHLSKDFSVKNNIPSGNYYKDFYKVVTDWETRSDWNVVLPSIKADAILFHKSLLQRELQEDGQTETFIAGKLAPAHQGNILEAVNLALNIFDKHYIDRDLLRTGLSIVVVSPAYGMLEATRSLLRLTSERMIEDGIGLDWVCLNRPPLYTVPLFRFHPTPGPSQTRQQSTTDLVQRKSAENIVKLNMKEKKINTRIGHESIDALYDDVSSVASGFPDESEWLYTIPHWIDMSFYDSFGNKNEYFVNSAFKPRIRKPKLDLSFKENQGKIQIGVPKLNLTNLDMGAYDQMIFDRLKSAQPLSPQQHQQKFHYFNNSFVKPVSSETGDDYGLTTRVSLSYSPTKNSSNVNINTVNSTAAVDNSSPESTVSAKALMISPFQLPIDRQVSNPILINKTKKELPQKSSYRQSLLGRSPSKRNLLLSDSPGKETRYLTQANMNSFQRNIHIDPCNPNSNLIKISSHLRRWHHIFPKLLQKTTAIVKWTSLCTPACLPLTTDYFPSVEELSVQYQEYTYTVSVNEDFSNPAIKQLSHDQMEAQKRTENLLMELISQRLVQGFQLVVGTNTVSLQHQQQQQNSINLHNNLSTPTLQANFPFTVTSPTSAKFIDTQISLSVPIYLSMGHQVHRLVYDPAGQNVEVKRYVKKLGDCSTPKYKYTCAMWTKDRSSYVARNADFCYPESSDYNWNYLDHVVSGYQDELTESLRFWRTRFILIPLETVSSSTLLNPLNETLTEEEIRLAGFLKFIELFHKARTNISSPQKEHSLKENAITSKNIPIIFTTFNTSTYVINEVRSWNFYSSTGEILNSATSDEDGGRKSFSLLERFSKDSKFQLITAALQHSSSGVSIKDRRWHLRYYEKVFIGSDCVDWLIKSFTDINTRDEAVEFGNLLLEKGVFEHVNKKHRFLDGHYFYRVSKDYALIAPVTKEEKGLGMRWFRQQKSADSTQPQQQQDDPHQSQQLPQIKTMQKIELSKKITIDLDPQKKSYRKELAILHYDTVHNPKNSYHFHLHWLVCTARLVEDLLQSWSRFAERCGLRLIEAPVEQAKLDGSDDNPFQSPVEIFMAVSPPLITNKTNGETFSIPHGYFETELIKHFGFILDVEADEKFLKEHVIYSFARPKYKYTQFVHVSGAAFIQIRESGNGFLWVNNRLLASHSQTSNTNNKAIIAMADALRKEFTTFCADSQRLNAFWTEALNHVQNSSTVLLEETTDDSFLLNQK